MVNENKSLLNVKTGEIIPITPSSQMALTLADTMELGQVLAESGMFPDCKNKAQAVAKILLGRELGLSPVYSLQKIYVVQGRLQIGYELVAALINKSEHWRYQIETLTDNECRIVFLRDGQPVGPPVTWTIADARTANLVKPESSWAKYPDVMLFARAITQGARRYCPELLAGTTIVEEGQEREVAPNGQLTKLGEPPPSAWMGFWGEVRRINKTWTDDQVHHILGVASVKDWLSQGKTFAEALDILRAKQAEVDTVELYRSEADPQQVRQVKGKDEAGVAEASELAGISIVPATDTNTTNPVVASTDETAIQKQARIDELSRVLAEAGWLPEKRPELWKGAWFAENFGKYDPKTFKLADLSIADSRRMIEAMKLAMGKKAK